MLPPAAALALAAALAVAGPATAQEQKGQGREPLPLPPPLGAVLPPLPPATPPAVGAQAAADEAAAGAVPAGSPDEGAGATGSAMPIRAQLRSWRFTTLAAGIPARIDRLEVLEGQRVAKGQALIAFDCSAEQAARRAAAARAEAARAAMRADAELVKRGGAGQVKADLSRAEHAAAVAELQRLETMLEKCAIAAPFDALVTRKAAQQYQFVNAGEPLLELVDTGAIEVDMVVPSRWLGWLRPGHAFDLRLDETGDLLPGRVDRYAGTVDPVSQTVRLIGRLEAPPDSLLPGMSGLLHFAPPGAAAPAAAGGSGEAALR